MKIFKYILILIVLVGLFGPIALTQVESSTGACRDKATDQTISRTQVQCGFDSNRYWAVTTTSQSDPISPYQLCKDVGGSYENCKNLSGRLATPTPTPNPTPTPTPTPVPLTPPILTPAPADPAKNYTFLAPLTGEKTFNASQDKPLSNYINVMIKLFIGICAVLAVIMIVVGGMEYMTSELISSKEQGKTRITEALLGLIVALSAYALLNTINPALLNLETKSLTKVVVEVELDEANYGRTEQAVTAAGTAFRLNSSTSSGVSQFVADKLSKGTPLRVIKVDTQNNRAYLYVGPEGDWSQFVTVPINKGFNGVAEAGQGKAGDAKTPKGTFTITGDRRIPGNGRAVLSNNGGYNLGAAFINIGVGNRGIGFHGSANNSLGTTNGCIRMSNDDLIALAPYMKAGVRVIIE